MTKPIEDTRSLRHLQALSKELEVPKVLDDKQGEYLSWLQLSPSLRVPKTKSDMAEVLGTTVSSLKRWENLPHFREALRKSVEEGIATPERVEEATRLAYERGVIDGDIKWATLWAQMAGLTKVEPALRKSTAEQMADLSDEELDALLFESAASEAKRRKREA